MKYFDSNMIFKDKDEFLKYAIDKYYGEILMFITKSTRNYHDAEDIAQDTFSSFYSSIERFRHESSLKTYIYRIAVNKIINFENKKKRENNKILSFFTKAAEQEKPDRNAAGNELQNKELKEIIKNALESFPAKQKVILSLRLFKELKIREISEILETSEGNVKAQLSTGLRKLQDILKEHGYGM